LVTAGPQESHVANERQQRAARAEQMRKEREKADRKQRNVITIAIVAVVVALIAVGGYAIHKTSSENSVSDKYVVPKNVTNKKDFGFDYSAVDAGGKAGAKPVTVVLYEDFQCPICKAFESANGTFLDDQVKSGAITIQYRPYAFLDGSSSTKYATRAMNAAMCVLDKGGVAAYKKMHDILYTNQPEENTAGLPDSSLIDFADQAGVTGLKTCIKSQKFAPWVVKAKGNVQKAGINGTPTVVIDGKTVTGPKQNGSATVPQVADLQKAITAAS
jgi:protein-disulfide isomerase